MFFVLDLLLAADGVASTGIAGPPERLDRTGGGEWHGARPFECDGR